ncbi:HAD family acid phosphatase [Streptomyces sp. NPDC054863]
MRKSYRAAGIATACALAGGALWGVGTATAGTPATAAAADASAARPVEAKSGHEPHNIGQLVGEIDDYYGVTQDARGIYRASPNSPYAKDVAHVIAKAKRNIERQMAGSHRANTHGANSHGANSQGAAGGRSAKPAIVLDIDDTMLLSIDYEKRTHFHLDPVTWKQYVERADRPAVFGMPELVAFAKKQGVEVFFLTGLAEEQRGAATKNLARVGVGVDHLFLKDKANPPSYLKNCATSKEWNCTTVQFKSGTRKHIESAGYDIIGSFGDQYSDLEGGYADKTYKLPNPTYFIK